MLFINYPVYSSPNTLNRWTADNLVEIFYTQALIVKQRENT
jgi:hypothetical protein